MLPIAVGATNTRIRHNIPTPRKLTFDLLILKVVSESRVTWATCVPILVFLGLPYVVGTLNNTRNSLDSIITAMDILNQTVCFQVRKKSANFLNKKFEYFWENTAAG